MFAIFFSEFLGTAVLLFLGTSIIAQITLRDESLGKSSPFLIPVGWGTAVVMGTVIAYHTGGSLNPAITLVKYLDGQINFYESIFYLMGEFLGATFGSLLTIYFFWSFFKNFNDQSKISEIFYTKPKIRNNFRNFLTEMLGTMILVLVVSSFSVYQLSFVYTAFLAGLIVCCLSYALADLSGCAINPARDIGPRFIHWIVKIPNKQQSSEWNYAWIPTIAPMLGALIAFYLFQFLLLFS